MTNVVIGLPAGDMMHTDTSLCLAQLCMYCISHPFKDGDGVFTIHRSKGTILPQSRQSIVDSAMEGDASHILFIDSDQTFPPYTLHRLLSHGVDFIGCNVATKAKPSYPTVRKKGRDMTGEPVYSDGSHHRRDGREKVWRIGTGVLLVSIEVVKAITRPHFEILWNEELQKYSGEDWNFCRKAEEAGFDIWVDHELSQEIGHLGHFEYTHTQVNASRRFLESDRKVVLSASL